MSNILVLPSSTLDLHVNVLMLQCTNVLLPIRINWSLSVKVLKSTTKINNKGWGEVHLKVIK